MLRDAFGAVAVVTPVPARGSFAHLPAAIARSDEADTNPRLAEYLRNAQRHGVIATYLGGLETGHAWAPCNVCGEVVLIGRGKNHGLTDGGVPSRAAVTDGPVCKMTPGCSGHHVAPALPKPVTGG